ncbi:MAG: hypothetical protein ACJ764_05560 [Solirubrobacteraceae bacterium]
MKTLILTSEPISAQQLRDALGQDAEDDEVLVVAPALQESGLRFWTADADEAIDKAQEVWRRTVGELSEAGVSAHGDTGESDPLQAIQDSLQTFPAQRIVLFRHPEEEQRYREDFDLDEVRERFGLPVEEALVPAA